MSLKSWWESSPREYRKAVVEKILDYLGIDLEEMVDPVEALDIKASIIEGDFLDDEPSIEVFDEDDGYCD